MKRTFTVLAAMALAMAAGAQGTGATDGLATWNPQAATEQDGAGRASKAPRKIRIDDGERLVGFYTTDYLPDFVGTFCMDEPGQYPIGVLFDDQILNPFYGGQITRFRFGVAETCLVHNAFIYAVDLGLNVGDEPLALVDISQTLGYGWHDVELPEPITIEEGTRYLLGFEFTQEEGSYPLVSDYGIETDYTSPYGFFAYGNLGTGGVKWYYQTGFGSLCIQAVVKGGDFTDTDVALDNLSARRYTVQGGELSYGLDICSLGMHSPASYTLSVAIDGNEVDVLDTPMQLSTQYGRLSGTLDLDPGLSIGEHTLSVGVGLIEGEAPTEYVDDDYAETRFMVYDGESAGRQRHLVEHFTSTGGINATHGINVMDTLAGSRPDKYAIVSMHYTMSSSSPDQYVLEDGGPDYIYYFSGLTTQSAGIPAAVFGRSILDDEAINEDGTMAIGINYEGNAINDAVERIDKAVDAAYADIPAFVSVDIATEYDEDARALAITVSGEGPGSSREMLRDARLTVYLTEDGVVGRQRWEEGTYMDLFTHDNVLRMIASGYPWGDEIAWTSDTGYSNTLNVTLDGSWRARALKVVAFISGPMMVETDGVWAYGAQDGAYVFNANEAMAIGNGDAEDTGLSAIPAAGGTAEVARYAIDGRRLGAPVRGVNIVRDGDGTTRKVVVR